MASRDSQNFIYSGSYPLYCNLQIKCVDEGQFFHFLRFVMTVHRVCLFSLILNLAAKIFTHSCLSAINGKTAVISNRKFRSYFCFQSLAYVRNTINEQTDSLQIQGIARHVTLTVPILIRFVSHSLPGW